MEELKQALAAANRAVIQNRRLIEELNGKRAAIEADRPKMELEVEAAQRSVNEELDKFVSGTVTQDEVDGARNILSAATRALANQGELGDAVERSMKREIVRTGRLNNEALRARRVVWEQVYKDLQKMVLEALPGDLVLKAYAVKRMNGGAGIFGQQTFLCSLLGNPHPLPDEMGNLTKALAAEYEIPE